MERVFSHVTTPAFLTVLSLFVALFVAEQFFPKYRFEGTRTALVHRIGRNLGLGVIYRVLIIPLLLAPIVVAAANIHFWSRPAFALGWPSFIVDLLVLDLLNYSLHVVCHRVPVLWRFHAVHHLDEHIDATTGFRQHFGEKVMTVAARVIIVVGLSIPVSHVVVFESVALAFGVFHHHNLNVPYAIERVINWVAVMPSFHGIHHGRAVNYTNSNYGFILSIWDRLFRTFSTDVRPPEFRHGLDAHHDPTLVTLVMRPFVPTRPFPTASTRIRPEFDPIADS